MDKEKILGFEVCSNSEEELINSIFEEYEKKNQVMVVNINPEIVINNYNDKDFVNKLNAQKYKIPDGIGIVYASKLRKGKIKKRIAGIDFMNKIIEKSIQYNSKIFLYGSKPEIIKNAKKKIEFNYPKVNIVGIIDGFRKEEEIISMINAVNPDIIFVGIGSPKQEKFILENKEKFPNVRIFMPVGGSFDVISNTLKRAPKWMIKLNLEWLYRLIQQPKRLFRQLKLISFIKCVIVEQIKNGREKNKWQK